MPAFEWVHVQLHQQKGMISLSPPTICNSAMTLTKIGVAQANSQGDIQLFINPDCATGKVLLYRKD
ncbi:hypothetical protein QR278_22060 [Salmonella enterica]|nr:hypothetical protein [Salmonella enterica]